MWEGRWERPEHVVRKRLPKVGTFVVFSELQGDIPIGKSSKNKVARSSACLKHMHIVTVAALTAVWARAIG